MFCAGVFIENGVKLAQGWTFTKTEIQFWALDRKLAQGWTDRVLTLKLGMFIIVRLHMCILDILFDYKVAYSFGAGFGVKLAQGWTFTKTEIQFWALDRKLAQGWTDRVLTLKLGMFIIVRLHIVLFLLIYYLLPSL
ncbi:hypothetical protein ACJX0J_036770 [Zea mays]